LGGNWSYLNLTGATVITDAVVANLDASCAILSGANIDNLQTSSSTQAPISFANAQMIGTALNGAYLPNAAFTSAIMFGAGLRGATLTGSTWADAYLGGQQPASDAAT